MTRRQRQLLVALALCGALGAAAPRPADFEDIKALAENGRSAKALQRLEKLLADQPDRLDGGLLKGVLLVELGRTDEAEKIFGLLAGRHADRPEPLNNLAVLQALSGRREAAAAALAQIVEAYPSYEAAAANLEGLRSAESGAGADPLSPDMPSVRLVLTAEPGTYARAALQPPPAPLPAPGEPGEPGLQAPEAREAEPDASAARPEADSAAPPLPAAPIPPDSDLRTELEQVVTAWAAAWSQQRVKEYLAFYATDFQPGGYPSREAWEAARRQRVAAPAFIEVEVDLDSMTLRQTGPDAASVTFTQRYRSDRYGDTVAKTLDLVRHAGAWRIRGENSG